METSIATEYRQMQGAYAALVGDYLQPLQELYRDFVDNYLRPHERDIERANHFPIELRRELVKRAIEHQLFAPAIPAEIGGGGLSQLALCYVREELGKTIPALGGVAGVVEGPPPILLACSPEQRESYLLPGMRGEKFACFALTEPNAGSDAVSIQTKATRVDGGFRLDGTKHFISNGDIADFAIVFAVTDRSRGSHGITAFLVDKGTPGFTTARLHEMMGHHGTREAEFSFQDCFVPDDRVLGEVHEGFTLAMRRINGAKLTIAANATGAADLLLDLATRYAKQRVQFGEPIANRQAIQFMLADSATEIFATRTMTHNTAWELDENRDVRLKAAMIKVFATEMLGRVADRALQVHGGMGYSKDLPIERIYRDSRLWRIVDGTSEVQRWVIARMLLRG